MKIIAITNIKGGVGKTTTAVNLSYLCAASGRPTLLWDLDPQGAATYTLRGEPHEGASAKKLLKGKRQLPELILSTGYPSLDLLPADFSYRNFDVHIKIAIREIRRQKIQARVSGGQDQFRQLALALQQFLGGGAFVRFASQGVRRGTLGIQVP